MTDHNLFKAMQCAGLRRDIIDRGCVLFSRLVGIVTLSCGTFAFLGDAFHFYLFTTPATHEVSFKANAALALILSGLGLLLLTKRHTDQTSAELYRLLAVICSSVVALLGLLTVFEYCGWDINIDELFGNDNSLYLTSSPGRMGLNTAICYTFLGISQLIAAIRTRDGVLGAQMMLIPAAVFELLSICGYIYGVPHFYGLSTFTHMALRAAILLTTLTVAMLFLQSDQGLPKQLTNDTVGGLAARILLPASIIIPLGLGWLVLQGQVLGFYGERTQLALIVVSMVIVFMSLAWWISRILTEEEYIRKQAEGLERTRLVVANAYDAFVSIDSAGRITEWNARSESLFGWRHTEVIGKSLLQIMIPPQHRDTLRQRADKYLSAASATVLYKRIEITALNRDGSEIPVELAVFPITMGDSLSFGAFIQDISDRKESERRVREFYSVVSHELRTPLTSIRGSLGLLQGGIAGNLSPKATRLIDIACDESDRLIRLINDILDVRKIAAGKLTLSLTDLDAEELVQLTFDGIRGFADQSAVRLESEMVGDHSLTCDRDRMVQVLTNLVSNAIKFSPAGSMVLVRVESPADDTVRFSVIDNGPGIPADQRHKLFGLFQQVDSSDSRPQSGTGLGLAISKGIVEQHGGKIDLESPRGVGSTFWFEIPSRIQSGVDKSPQRS